MKIYSSIFAYNPARCLRFIELDNQVFFASSESAYVVCSISELKPLKITLYKNNCC